MNVLQILLLFITRHYCTTQTTNAHVNLSSHKFNIIHLTFYSGDRSDEKMTPFVKRITRYLSSL